MCAVTVVTPHGLVFELALAASTRGIHTPTRGSSTHWARSVGTDQGAETVGHRREDSLSHVPASEALVDCRLGLTR